MCRRHTGRSNLSLVMQKTRQVHAVCFDLGGVVLLDEFSDIVVQRAARLLHADAGLLRDAMRREQGPMQCGKEPATEFWLRVCRSLEMGAPAESSLRDLLVRGYRRHTKPNRELLQVVAQLRSKCPVALISNTIPEHTELIVLGDCSSRSTLSSFLMRSVCASRRGGSSNWPQRLYKGR